MALNLSANAIAILCNSGKSSWLSWDSESVKVPADDAVGLFAPPWQATGQLSRSTSRAAAPRLASMRWESSCSLLCSSACPDLMACFVHLSTCVSLNMLMLQPSPQNWSFRSTRCCGTGNIRNLAAACCALHSIRQEKPATQGDANNRPTNRSTDRQ